MTQRLARPTQSDLLVIAFIVLCAWAVFSVVTTPRAEPCKYGMQPQFTFEDNGAITSKDVCYRP